MEKYIYDWATKYNSLIVKSDRDTFFCIMEQRYLKEAEADKFNILDEVKDIDVPDITQPTLSIGFSDDGSNNEGRKLCFCLSCGLKSFKTIFQCLIFNR